MGKLSPYYVIQTSNATDPEDRLDVALGVSTAARPGEPGLLPRDLARALDAAARHIPIHRRAAEAWRQMRRFPGAARAHRN